jgi:hypothetical protein
VRLVRIRPVSFGAGVPLTEGAGQKRRDKTTSYAMIAALRNAVRLTPSTNVRWAPDRRGRSVISNRRTIMGKGNNSQKNDKKNKKPKKDAKKPAAKAGK